MIRVALAVVSAFVTVTPAANPPQSIPPTQAFAVACYGKQKPTKACAKEAIKNINSAHALEGLGPIVLPGNYQDLNLKQKMIAVSNAERTIRGLPAVVETAANDRLAKKGARTSSDPIGPHGHAWGSIWAGGVGDPLAADYLWMYDDGPGGINLDCVHPGDPGCWGHREVILGPSYLTAGAGHDGDSLAELFVQ